MIKIRKHTRGISASLFYPSWEWSLLWTDIWTTAFWIGEECFPTTPSMCPCFSLFPAIFTGRIFHRRGFVASQPFHWAVHHRAPVCLQPGRMVCSGSFSGWGCESVSAPPDGRDDKKGMVSHPPVSCDWHQRNSAGYERKKYRPLASPGSHHVFPSHLSIWRALQGRIRAARLLERLFILWPSLPHPNVPAP